MSEEGYVTFTPTGIYVDLKRYLASPEGKAAFERISADMPRRTAFRTQNPRQRRELDMALSVRGAQQREQSIYAENHQLQARLDAAAVAWNECKRTLILSDGSFDVAMDQMDKAIAPMPTSRNL